MHILGTSLAGLNVIKINLKSILSLKEAKMQKMKNSIKFFQLKLKKNKKNKRQSFIPRR